MYINIIDNKTYTNDLIISKVKYGTALIDFLNADLTDYITKVEEVTAKFVSKNKIKFYNIDYANSDITGYPNCLDAYSYLCKYVKFIRTIKSSCKYVDLHINELEENLRKVREHDIDEFNKTITNTSPNMNEAIKNVISSYGKYLIEYLIACQKTLKKAVYYILDVNNTNLNDLSLNKRLAYFQCKNDLSNLHIILTYMTEQELLDMIFINNKINVSDNTFVFKEKDNFIGLSDRQLLNRIKSSNVSISYNKYFKTIKELGIFEIEQMILNKTQVKRCEFCDNYFISNDKKKKTCSTICGKKVNYQKTKQDELQNLYNRTLESMQKGMKNNKDKYEPVKEYFKSVYNSVKEMNKNSNEIKKFKKMCVDIKAKTPKYNYSVDYLKNLWKKE